MFGEHCRDRMDIIRINFYRDAMAKVLSYGFEVSKFELQSRYQVPFSN